MVEGREGRGGGGSCVRLCVCMSIAIPCVIGLPIDRFAHGEKMITNQKQLGLGNQWLAMSSKVRIRRRNLLTTHMSYENFSISSVESEFLADPIQPKLSQRSRGK